jgi:HK97 family phage major capsid protein
MTVEFKAEPLTYHQHGRHSFFRDLVFEDRVPGAEDRLRHHAVEMDVIRAERDRRAWGAMRSGDFGYERRVEPNRIDGQGGFFSPRAWVNELFATARRPGRVLAGLIPAKFELPLGVSSVNLPVIGTGTTDTVAQDNAAVPGTDFTDSAGSSFCASFAGQSNIPLQMLEQSPVGASIDWVIFTDMGESYDAELESQILYGTGTANQQLPGIVPNSGITPIAYTDSSPTGAEMWPFLAQGAAQLGDARDLPPELWLMRTARWAWLQGQTSTTGYPFGISPIYLGKDDDTTPDPIGGLMGWPVFLDDAISATLGGNQDEAIVVRPSDLVLFETAPMTSINREPGAGNLSCIIEMHGYAAAITRYTTATAVVGGSGFAVASGY